MRKRLAKLPSPAMGVAFVALLAGLAGTAVALPGSNTVTTGDIRNGAVRTQDIRNSTVRGRDVRNNTLTGTDVNEGSLGTVPTAGAANIANAASLANRANSAAAVDKLIVSNRVSRAFGDPFTSTGGVVVATKGPFTLRLSCNDDTGTHYSSLLLVGPSGSAAQDGGGNSGFLGAAPDNFVVVTEVNDAGTGDSGFFANEANVAMTTPTGASIQARGYAGINLPGTTTECVGGGTLEG